MSEERMDAAPLSPPASDWLDALEARLAELPQYAQALTQHAGALNQLGQQVTHLSQQRAMAELQMERNTRATALDLAIKAVGEKAAGAAPDMDQITLLAGVFLGWLKQQEN